MPERSRKRPTDLNKLAASIVDDATTENKEAPDDGKDHRAVELGRIGGRIGGRVRAEKMTPEQRSASARNAALARWARSRSGSERI
jgi:hypothetical protein